MDKKKETYKKELDRKFKPLYDYNDLAHKWRGEVINHAINLEQTIEIFIARHYVLAKTKEDYEEKIKEFRRIMFWELEMGFGDKMKITKNLIKKHHPDFNVMDLTQDYEKEMTDIISCRNRMAHWQLDISKIKWTGAKDKTIKLNKLTIGKDQTYIEKEIKTVIENCNKYITILYHWPDYPLDNVLSP